LIAWHTEAISGLDPETGKAYWSIPFGPARSGVTILTPRFVKDEKLGTLLFIATQYEGSTVIKLDEKEPRAAVLWHRAGRTDKKTDALHVLMMSPAIRGGYLYGVDSYGELRCLELASGDRLWSTNEATTGQAGQQKWATAFIIPMGEAGKRYLIANEHGDLILADMDSSGYREVSRAHVLEASNPDPQRAVVWCYPACADRSVFWRNDREMVRVEMEGK
jgi:outer membrane protein assembly factor BamB